MKLIPSLGNKTNCVLCYRNFQLYFPLGIKLNKFRRVLKFKQSDWINKYIDFKVNKSVYIAKSRQRYYKTLNNILLHVPNHALKDVYMLIAEL